MAHSHHDCIHSFENFIGSARHDCVRENTLCMNYNTFYKQKNTYPELGGVSLSILQSLETSFLINGKNFNSVAYYKHGSRNESM